MPPDATGERVAGSEHGSRRTARHPTRQSLRPRAHALHGCCCCTLTTSTNSLLVLVAYHKIHNKPYAPLLAMPVSPIPSHATLVGHARQPAGRRVTGVALA
jgi:hypothetical protein